MKRDTPGLQVRDRHPLTVVPTIWIVNSDGSNRRRLTTGKQPDLYPQVTGDGRQIVFVSVQSGLRNIWRMDIDGTNLKQLTFDGGDAPEVALDGTVFYTRSETTWADIWKVPISGGTPAPIGRKSCQLQAVSRDGRLMAYSPLGSSKTIVVPTNGGEPVATFDDLGEVKFGPDGRILLYEKRTKGTWQLWEQPIPLGKGRKVLSIDLPSAGNVSTMKWALTPDGKNVVYSMGVWQEDIHLFAEPDKHQPDTGPRSLS